MDILESMGADEEVASQVARDDEYVVVKTNKYAVQAARARMRQALFAAMPEAWKRALAATPETEADRTAMERVLDTLIGRALARAVILPPAAALWLGLPSTPAETRVVFLAHAPHSRREFSTGAALALAAAPSHEVPEMFQAARRARRDWAAAHPSTAAFPNFNHTLQRWTAQGAALLHVHMTTEEGASGTEMGWDAFALRVLRAIDAATGGKFVIVAVGEEVARRVMGDEALSAREVVMCAAEGGAGGFAAPVFGGRVAKLPRLDVGTLCAVNDALAAMGRTPIQW